MPQMQTRCDETSSKFDRHPWVLPGVSLQPSTPPGCHVTELTSACWCVPHLSADAAACHKLLHPLPNAWVCHILVVEVGQLSSGVGMCHHAAFVSQGVAGVLLALCAVCIATSEQGAGADGRSDVRSSLPRCYCRSARCEAPSYSVRGFKLMALPGRLQAGHCGQGSSCCVLALQTCRSAP